MDCQDSFYVQITGQTKPEKKDNKKHKQEALEKEIATIKEKIRGKILWRETSLTLLSTSTRARTYLLKEGFTIEKIPRKGPKETPQQKQENYMRDRIHGTQASSKNNGGYILKWPVVNPDTLPPENISYEDCIAFAYKNFSSFLDVYKYLDAFYTLYLERYISENDPHELIIKDPSAFKLKILQELYTYVCDNYPRMMMKFFKKVITDDPNSLFLKSTYNDAHRFYTYIPGYHTKELDLTIDDYMELFDSIDPIKFDTITILRSMYRDLGMRNNKLVITKLFKIYSVKYNNIRLIPHLTSIYNGGSYEQELLRESISIYIFLVNQKLIRVTDEFLEALIKQNFTEYYTCGKIEGNDTSKLGNISFRLDPYLIDIMNNNPWYIPNPCLLSLFLDHIRINNISVYRPYNLGCIFTVLSIFKLTGCQLELYKSDKYDPIVYYGNEKFPGLPVPKEISRYYIGDNEWNIKYEPADVTVNEIIDIISNERSGALADMRKKLPRFNLE